MSTATHRRTLNLWKSSVHPDVTIAMCDDHDTEMLARHACPGADTGSMRRNGALVRTLVPCSHPGCHK